MALVNSSAFGRTWPKPTRSWLMRMNWHDLLFMHWRVDAEELRPLIPQGCGLEIDIYDQSAWIGIVPFRMTGVAPRFSPDIPLMSSFPELNVRTYVSIDGKPGVWFFCLEATNPIAVRVARKLFHLPYMDAKIEMMKAQSDHPGRWIEYHSTRTHRNEPGASLNLEYRPIGSAFHAQPGSIEEFLTSRYCLYSANSNHQVFRGEIDHDPWELREAQAIVKENTMVDWLGITLPDEPPLLHYAKLAKCVAWSLEKTM